MQIMYASNDLLQINIKEPFKKTFFSCSNISFSYTWLQHMMQKPGRRFFKSHSDEKDVFGVFFFFTCLKDNFLMIEDTKKIKPKIAFQSISEKNAVGKKKS